MPRHRCWTALLLALLAGSGAIAGCSPASQRVVITMRYSAFEPSALSVPHGVPVTFVLVNEDPIDHEWIIGDAAVHAVHRHGTEAHHGARPTEVSVPALSTVETTITFEEPGTLSYVCHVPRHEAYGMVGIATVT